jgi:hypothetical protein
MPKDPAIAAIAARLHHALDASGMTLMEFSNRLRPLNVEYSTATLQRYVSGESEPSFRWITEAAPILGVRMEWLSSGAGPQIDAQRTSTRSRLIAELAASAPIYFAPADRITFGELVRRAMYSLAFDEAKARELVMEIVTGPVTAVARSLKLPGIPEACLRRFVTDGRPSTSSFPEMPHASEYVRFVLQAAARAIPELPRPEAELPAAAKARGAIKPRRPK